MGACNDPKYTCGKTTEITTGTKITREITTDFDRLVIFEFLTSDAQTTSITVQNRKRRYKYTDVAEWTANDVILVRTNEADFPCYGSVSSASSSTFYDEYTTVDTELEFLDLRNGIVVTKETTEKVILADKDNIAPDNYVSVFTGYDSVILHPYQFSYVPIQREIIYNLIINGTVTELAKDHVDAGNPMEINLLMPVAPSRTNVGFRIDSPSWARDIDWYLQIEHREEDGNQWLFWPPWLRAIGVENQTIDMSNRDLVYGKNGYGSSTLTTSIPNINKAEFFRGSVAINQDNDMFYSIATPQGASSINCNFFNKLIIKGTEVALKKERVRDRPWTNEKDSEYNVWFPIAPL